MVFTKEQIESLSYETTIISNNIDWELLEEALNYYKSNGDFNLNKTKTDDGYLENIQDYLVSRIDDIFHDFSNRIDNANNWDEIKEKERIKDDLLKLGLKDDKYVDNAYNTRVPDPRITEQYQNILDKYSNDSSTLAQDFIQWYNKLKQLDLEKEDWETVYEFLSRAILKPLMNYFEISNTDLSQKEWIEARDNLNIPSIIGKLHVTPLVFRRIILPLIKEYEFAEDEMRMDYLEGIGEDNHWYQYQEDVFAHLNVDNTTENPKDGQFRLDIITYSFNDLMPICTFPYLESIPTGNYPYNLQISKFSIEPSYRIDNRHNINIPFPILFDKELDMRIIFSSSIKKSPDFKLIKEEMSKYKIIQDEVSIYLDEEFKEWIDETKSFLERKAVSETILPIISDPEWFSNINSVISQFQGFVNDLNKAKDVMLKFFLSRDNDLQIVLNIIQRKKIIKRESILEEWAKVDAMMQGKEISLSSKNNFRSRFKKIEAELRETRYIRVNELRKSKLGGPNIIEYEYLENQDVEVISNLTS